MTSLQPEQSLLTQEESTAIRGVLIFLIVLGHCQYFTDITSRWEVMGYLYLFHVKCFFLLPFLYPLKSLTWQRATDLLIRCYVPFLLFLLGFFLYRWGTGQIHVALWFLPASLFAGGGRVLFRLTGLRVLWFLPALFATLLLKEGWQRSRTIPRICLLAIGFLEILWALYCANLPQNAAIWLRRINFWSFYVQIALCYLPIGLLLRWALLSKRFSCPFFLVVFLLCTVMYFYHTFAVTMIRYPVNRMSSMRQFLSYLATPAFLALLYFSRATFARASWLRLLGQHSLLIYLMHPLLGHIFYAARFRIPLPSWFWVLPTTLLCCVIPLLISYYLDRLPCVRALLIPRSWQEWKNAICSSRFSPT
ncbi:MAG: acyltransferase family protein [Victivallales bacterium]|nr:acyltransferase family protein [Victivallales bacterium]